MNCVCCDNKTTIKVMIGTTEIDVCRGCRDRETDRIILFAHKLKLKGIKNFKYE